MINSRIEYHFGGYTASILILSKSAAYLRIHARVMCSCWPHLDHYVRAYSSYLNQAVLHRDERLDADINLDKGWMRQIKVMTLKVWRKLKRVVCLPVKCEIYEKMYVFMNMLQGLVWQLIRLRLHFINTCGTTIIVSNYYVRNFHQTKQ